jgi:hypothetical protein
MATREQVVVLVDQREETIPEDTMMDRREAFVKHENISAEL